MYIMRRFLHYENNLNTRSIHQFHLYFESLDISRNLQYIFLLKGVILINLSLVKFTGHGAKRIFCNSPFYLASGNFKNKLINPSR